MTDKIIDLCDKIRADAPLIHAITNPISINLLANSVLAMGAKPICAEHPKEVDEITRTSNALLLNLGNITNARMKSMKISASCAMKSNIPFVLDAVGVSCSHLRKKYALRLIKKYPPTLIKGNYSEIKALSTLSYFGHGVDADNNLTPENIAEIVTCLARKTGAFVLASGKTDILSCGGRTLLIHGGTRLLSRITGTGCLLGMLSATFLSCEKSLDAILSAAVFLGLCAKSAEGSDAPFSFGIRLMDNINLFSRDAEKFIKSEDFYIEEI